MDLALEAKQFYPTQSEVDAFALKLAKRARTVHVAGELLDISNVTPSFGNGPNALDSQYVRFTTSDGRRPFYGYWQKALSVKAPLLINLPGYGGYISMHPQLSDMGYNILHISPLGYVEPDGVNKLLQTQEGNWPVLCCTARGEAGGYADWVSDCMLAIRWAQKQDCVQADRLSLYGTSQGGGGALLLASILGEGVQCVCADLPFLTDFAHAGFGGTAYGLLAEVHNSMKPQEFWHNIGLVDTLSHAHRLHIPTMLTAGGKDDTCPDSTVKTLFESLTCTKQYTWLKDGVHTHSRQSMFLFAAWLRMYA